MARMKIGEVAKRSQVPASTLRYYEQEGLLPKAGRVGGQRFYDDDVLDAIALIRMAKDTGFTLREMRTILKGPKETTVKRWRTMAQAKLVELEEHIAKMQQMKHLLAGALDCQCANPKRCVLLEATGHPS